jgi:Spy/CpxP family protein refolding chaperone
MINFHGALLFTKVLVLTTVFTVSIPVAVAYAHEEQCAFDEGQISNILPARIFGKLELTQSQREQVLKLRQENRKERKQGLTAINDLRDKLNQKLLSSAPDETLKDQYLEIYRIKAELKQNTFEKMLKLRTILTPEQRQKFNAALKENSAKLVHRGKEAEVENYWFD